VDVVHEKAYLHGVSIVIGGDCGVSWRPDTPIVAQGSVP